MQAPKFWFDSRPSFFSFLLTPLSCLIYYLGKCRFKNISGYKGKTPVICVGNATVGGTGKTPTAILTAQILIAHGYRPVFLTRGYKGTLDNPTVIDDTHTYIQTGDEAQILKCTAPVIVAKNRVAGAILADCLGYDVMILDDGLQNHPCFFEDSDKNLKILVVDRKTGFGNGSMIPAGLLREPVRCAIQKASLIFVTGSPDYKMPVPLEHIDKPLFSAIKKSVMHGDDLSGQNIVAFAGLGNNQQFFDMLTAMGGRLVQTESFSDHAPYNDAMIKRLIADAGRYDAILMTTEKDMVRINPVYYPYIRPFLITLSLCDADKMEFETILLDFMDKNIVLA